MNRFSRDYALVQSINGKVLIESNDLERLKQYQAEYAEFNNHTVIVKSDLPRDRLNG